MSIDVLASIVLTAGAAIVLSGMAVGFGEDTRSRMRIAGWLGLWFVLVAAMAAGGWLTYPHGLGTPGLGVAVCLPVIVMTGMVYGMPSLRRALRHVPLSLLVALHGVRVLGVFFLILHAAGRLPAPFAPLAGWGDVLAGAAAVPLAWLVRRSERAARPLVWCWNGFGMLDLVLAVALGAVSAPGPLQLIDAAPGTSLMTGLPWLLVPAFLVPLLAALHLAVFYRLSTGEQTPPPRWREGGNPARTGHVG